MVKCKKSKVGEKGSHAFVYVKDEREPDAFVIGPWPWNWGPFLFYFWIYIYIQPSITFPIGNSTHTQRRVTQIIFVTHKVTYKQKKKFLASKIFSK